MQQPLNFYASLVYFVTAIPYAWMGLIAWRRRPAVAVTPFAWAMLGMSIWSLGYGLELLAPTLFLKLLAVKFEYIGIAVIPVFLFIFSLEFTARRHYLPQRLQSLLWLYPSFFLIIVWTNELHHLMWSGETIVQTAGIFLLKVNYQLFFWLHTGFSYLLILAGNLLLFKELVRSQQTHRLQIGFVVIGLISPLIGSFIFVSESDVFSGLDPTPLFFIPTAFALYWVTMRYRLLKVMPLEHLTILQNLVDGVIVVDALKRVLYINPITENLFGRLEGDAIGQPLYQLSNRYGNELASYLTAGMSQAELRLGEGEQARFFEATISSASSSKSAVKTIGPDRMITLHDVTHRKEAEHVLYRRELMMSAISLAATEFLNEPAWEHAVPGVLEKIGRAADVSHVYIFINYIDKDNLPFTSLCYEWASPETRSHLANKSLSHIPIRQSGLGRWEKEFSQGTHIIGQVKDLPPSEQVLFATTESVSILAFPITIENQWWGFIMFDECGYKRYWTDIEVKALHTMASIFGSAETRARTEQRLLHRQKSLNLLHDIVRDALKAQELKEMAQNAVDRLEELIHADACFITQWDEINRKTSSLAASGPYRDTYANIQPPAGKKTLTESALELGHALITVNSHNSPYVDTEVAKNFSSESEIVLPLIANEKKLGALVFSFDTYHKFSTEEISICEQAANLIALAFEKFLAMEQAQRRAFTSETLRKASVVVTETLETDEVINRILEQLKEVISHDSASIQLLDGNELVIVGCSGFTEPENVNGMRFPIPGDNPNSIVIQTGSSQIFNDLGTQFSSFSGPEHDRFRSWLGVPLIVQDKIIGLLSIDSSELNDFTEEDAALALAFANQVSVALENTRLFSEAQTQAITDSLTGIYNRRGLFQVGDFEITRARRIGRPFSTLLLDIDHFKRVNDHYGHALGDQALRILAERCRMGSRNVDIVGRYGGEEFVLLLTETHLEAAYMVAERLRRSIMDTPFQTDAGPLRVTISIGVAEASNDETLKELIQRADIALYEAKNQGRNCVVISENPEPHVQI